MASAITRLAKSDSLDAQATERLLKFISAFEEIFDGLGFCLSEEGDLLIYSLSEAPPIKTGGFAARDSTLAGTIRYSDWHFSYVPPNPLSGS